jgi:hypothetical protein
MTREEAIEEVEVAFDIWESEYDTGNDWSKAHKARDMAIKALEQETVSKEAYDHEYFLRKEFELKIDKLQRQLEEQVAKAKSEWEQDHDILKAYSDGANEVLDKIRAEIAEYGSIMVAYAITEDIKTDKGIQKLVGDILHQAKEEVLEIIDKYKGESEG